MNGYIRQRQKVARTEQLDFEPNLGQRLDEVRSLLRRDVSAVTSEHVQPVRPVRPARRVRRNRVHERALRREQRERQRRRHERGARPTTYAVEGWRAVRGRDFRDQCEVKALGQVLEPAAHRELGQAVDVVHVLQAVVLGTRHARAAIQDWEHVRGRVKKGAYKAHEPPWSRGPPWRWGGDRHCVEKPCTLKEAVDALLAHKLFGFFVELRPQVAHGYFAQ